VSKEFVAKREMIGWAYVRVSTAEQSNVLHGSIEQQLNRIKRWESEQSERTGVPHRITRFIDEDISGRVESLHKRTEYHELIMAIKNKAIDFVVVEKLDRLHRNIIESRKFIDLCDAMDVKFYRLDGGLVDLKDRSSRTSVFIESWMAEEYSLDLVEKLTKKGREARVNNGKDNNSLTILGLDEHPTETCFYVINKDEQRIVVDIFRHFCSSGDLQQTAQYCAMKGYKTKERYTRAKVEKGKKVPPMLVGGQPFDRKNLRALLVNRKIAGYGYFKDDWHQFPHLQDEFGMVRWEMRHGPVVPIELFEKAQSILRKNAKYNHRVYADQRTYLLSGILFDKDGNRFSGQSVKNKKNPYYSNKAKKFRVRAERIENSVVSFLSTLLEKNGILKEAIKRAFGGEKNILKEIEEQISNNKKELAQCEQALAMIASKGRASIISNPDKFDDILLESLEIRKQTQIKMDALKTELLGLMKQKEELAKFKNQNDIQDRLKKALKLFAMSSSKRKKKLIELLVPKLVLDEQQDQLYLFVNPFLENSNKILQESIAEIEPILPKNLIQSNFGPIAEGRDSYCEILTHGGKKVCIADNWRTIQALHELFSSNQLFASLRRFTSIRSLKIKVSSLKNTLSTGSLRSKLREKFFPQKWQC
jgi:DNA invertase Pin-like site-specific DNA recombinase